MKKNHAAPPHIERPESNGSNIFRLPTYGSHARHRAIREFISGLSDLHENESAVAIACVVLRSDGTVSLSAKGIDSDLADDMLGGLQQISLRIRHQVRGKFANRGRQRGKVIPTTLAALALTIGAYLSPIPELDSVLVLAAHLIPRSLASRRRRQPIKG